MAPIPPSVNVRPDTTVPYTNNGLDNDGIFNDLPEDYTLTQSKYDFNY